MRRLVFSVVVASGLVIGGPSAAFAEDPAPTVSAPATPGKKICKITDLKLDELSGIVATATGFIVIDDSTLLASHKRIFFLDQKCKIVKEQQYSGAGPLDTEDMILSPDGQTLWIADTGDDGTRAATPTHRNTVALWTMPVDGSKKPKLHRLSYPEGDYHDAEALLLTGNSTPLIITKELGRPAGIYRPTEALKADNQTGVPMQKVGEITVSATETPGNTVARIGNKTIDGAAIAPGGGKVALRTYTDALEWDVAGGDVLAALKSKPRITGLPNEPFGEAITYSADGKFFYTVSDLNGDHETSNYITQYTPATTAAVTKAAPSIGGATATTHWYSNLTVDMITYLVGGVGALGLILVGIGVLGIRRSRRTAAAGAPAGLSASDPATSGDPETELIVVGGAPQRAGVYGGTPAGARSGPAPTVAPGVYGAPAGNAPAGRAGAVQGGGDMSRHGRPQAQPSVPRNGQQPPGRGVPPPPVRGGQQPAPAPQGPGRGGVYGGQPGAGAQGQPAHGGAAHGERGRGAAPQGQSGRGGLPQGQPSRGGAPQGQPGSGGGQQGQRPHAPGANGWATPGRGQGSAGQRPQRDTYGPGGHQQRGDGDADFVGNPESRFDNPGYGRR